MTKFGVDAIGMSTPLESNKSLRQNSDYSEPPCCHYYGLSSQGISSRISQELLISGL
jgi:hypothetical protein